MVRLPSRENWECFGEEAFEAGANFVLLVVRLAVAASVERYVVAAVEYFPVIGEEALVKMSAEVENFGRYSVFVVVQFGWNVLVLHY